VTIVSTAVIIVSTARQPMVKGNFDEFVKRQQSLAPDWKEWGTRQRDEWLRYLENLYAKIESFLDIYLSANQVRCEYLPLTLNEENIGTYATRRMVLHVGQ
jgi:hypothetical protein